MRRLPQGGIFHGALVFGDIKARNADGSRSAGRLHRLVQHDGRLLATGVTPCSSCRRSCTTGSPAPATVIPLEEAAQGYKAFDDGAAKTFVLDPHGLLAA